MTNVALDFYPKPFEARTLEEVSLVKKILESLGYPETMMVIDEAGNPIAVYGYRHAGTRIMSD